MNWLPVTLAGLCLGLSSPLQAQQKGHFQENADPRLERVMDHYVRSNSRKSLDGYRIQIYNGQRTEVNNYRSRFIRSFPNLVSRVIFETPDYKLQVGNYRTIYEAEQALSQIRTRFPGALIVETKIDPPELVMPDNTAPSRRMREDSDRQRRERTPGGVNRDAIQEGEN